MRFLALVFACLALGPPLVAQDSSAGPFTLNAANQCAEASVQGRATVVMYVSGTFSMTLQPKVAIQGQAASNTQVTPSTSTTAQSTITAAGNYRADVAGQDLFQLCATSYSSGSAVIYFKMTGNISTGLLGSAATGGSVSGTGTANTLPKWTGALTQGNSSITGDDGTHSPISPNGFDLGTLGALSNQIANNATTATVVNKLACDDGTGKVLICSHLTSTTNQPVGSVTNGAGTTGVATVAYIGFITVCFDNQSTSRDYAIASTTADGCLHDTGGTTLTAGQPNYFVWTANSGVLTNGVFRLLTADDFTVASCANCVTAAAALTNHTITLGTGGKGVKAGTLGTTTTVLHGNASGDPTYGAVVAGDCPTCALQSSVQNQSYVYASGGGTANAQTVTLSPALGSLVVGQYACWLPSNANASTTPTLAVNGLTAKTITKAGGAALAASDITTTAIACVIYDGTNYELQNPQTGGGGGAVASKTVNIPFDQCTPAQTTNGGNSFYTTIAFTNWDAGVWSFVLNTAADIFCSIKIPHNVNASPAALIIFDVSANDATASHTDVFSTTDAISSSKNLQVGSLSAGSPSTCTFTTTATAYAVTECSITPAATIAADQYLVVKIHQAASSSVTANVVMPPPMLQLLEDF